MNNICPEQVFDYFANVGDYQKAKKLSLISIDCCICHLTLPIEGHRKNFYCHCFKCRICRILLFALVVRKNGKLLLLSMNKSYKVISDNMLYDNIDFWR